MHVERMHFPPILPDNEETYYGYLVALIESIDNDSYMVLIKKDNGVAVRIIPSEYRRFIEILDGVKKFHTMLSIEVEFSKSMKAGNNIAFNIKF